MKKMIFIFSLFMGFSPTAFADAYSDCVDVWKDYVGIAAGPDAPKTAAEAIQQKCVPLREKGPDKSSNAEPAPASASGDESENKADQCYAKVMASEDVKSCDSSLTKADDACTKPDFDSKSKELDKLLQTTKNGEAAGRANCASGAKALRDGEGVFDEYAKACKPPAQQCLSTCKRAQEALNACKREGSKDSMKEAANFDRLETKIRQSVKTCEEVYVPSAQKAAQSARSYGNGAEEAESCRDAQNGTDKKGKEAEKETSKGNEQAKSECATNGSGSGSGSGSSGSSGGSGSGSGSSGSGSGSSGCGSGGGGGGSPQQGGGDQGGQQASQNPTSDNPSSSEATGLTSKEDKVVAARGNTIENPESSESSNSSSGTAGASGFQGMNAQRSPASSVGGSMGGGGAFGSSGSGGPTQNADGKESAEENTARAASLGGSYGGGGGGGWGSLASASSAEKEERVREMRERLPGQAKDPAKAAGLVGQDGVTDANQFNWDKMHQQFRRQSEGPIGFLP